MIFFTRVIGNKKAEHALTLRVSRCVLRGAVLVLERNVGFADFALDAADHWRRVTSWIGRHHRKVVHLLGDIHAKFLARL